MKRRGARWFGEHPVAVVLFTVLYVVPVYGGFALGLILIPLWLIGWAPAWVLH